MSRVRVLEAIRKKLPDVLSRPDLEMVALDYFRRLGHDNHRKNPNIARPEIQEVGSEFSAKVFHTRKELVYRQDEFLASDVNHLEAVDFSRTVKANPKEKPGVCEIDTIVDELLVGSLFEKVKRLEDSKVRGSGGKIRHAFLDRMNDRTRVLAIIRLPSCEASEFLLHALGASSIGIGLRLKGEQGDFGNIHTGNAKREAMGIGAEAVVEVRKHDHRDPLLREDHDSHACVTRMHYYPHPAIPV